MERNKSRADTKGQSNSIELHPEWLAGDGNNPHTFVKVRTDAIIAEVDPPETLIKRYKNLIE